MTVKFCLNCNNLLYPKSAKGYRKLYRSCRTCDYEEEAGTDLMVYKHELLAVVTEKAGVTDDVELDPTLPRSNKECPNCHGTSAVYFQDQSKRQVTNMRLFYKCRECLHVFKDPDAEEGPAKEKQRKERDLRLRNANKKKGSEDKAKEGAGAAAAGVAPVVAGQTAVQEANSDDEY